MLTRVISPFNIDSLPYPSADIPKSAIIMPIKISFFFTKLAAILMIFQSFFFQIEIRLLNLKILKLDKYTLKLDYSFVFTGLLTGS